MGLFMCCADVAELCTEDSEGALHGLGKARFAFHLVLCSGCRCYREQLDLTRRTLAGMPREAPPEELKELLLEHLRQTRSGVT